MRAWLNFGSAIARMIKIIAITISSSINEKPLSRDRRIRWCKTEVIRFTMIRRPPGAIRVNLPATCLPGGRINPNSHIFRDRIELLERIPQVRKEIEPQRVRPVRQGAPRFFVNLDEQAGNAHCCRRPGERSDELGLP